VENVKKSVPETKESVGYEYQADIDQIAKIFDKMEKEHQDEFIEMLEIRMAHIMRDKPEFRAQHADQWENLKHLANEHDYLGERWAKAA